jgi:hypothetical protein
MKEIPISRRSFLKLVGGACTGAVVGSITPEAALKVDSAVHEVTGIRSGNANAHAMLDKCADSGRSDCNEPQLTPQLELNATIIAPVVEEAMFRAVPSFKVSVNDKSRDPFADWVFGSGESSFTRRSVLAGTASSLLFGLYHNITVKGVDLKTIPASQAIVGGVLWCLQRRFGIAANTIAHMSHNYTALRRYKASRVSSAR